MNRIIKILAGISIAISLTGWLLDLGEFNGDIKLAVFEIAMMSLLVFLILLGVLTAWKAIWKLVQRTRP